MDTGVLWHKSSTAFTGLLGAWIDAGYRIRVVALEDPFRGSSRPRARNAEHP